MEKTKTEMHKLLLLLALASMSACGYAEWPPNRIEIMDENSPSLSKRQILADSKIRVQSGDSVFSIARLYKIPMRSIIYVNNLRPPFLLKVGQIIDLPKRGKEYRVKKGDTLFSISIRTKTDPYKLARLNKIRPPYTIYVNQKITLFDTQNQQPKTSFQDSSQNISKKLKIDRTKKRPSLFSDKKNGVRLSTKRIKKEENSTKHVRKNKVDIVRKKNLGFIWPVKGKILSNFGVKPKGLRNDGVNISADRGTPVLAAESGVVAYAGNELRGFGKLLLIKHYGKWITAYAHNEKLLVKRGQVLKKGQKIATVGSTGNVGSPQLHFEIRFGRAAKNPNKIIRNRSL